MVIASLNVNSLPAHHEEVKLLLHEKGIHLLALNETKIDPDYPRELLDIEGYRFDGLDRNRHGGGVGFYIQDNFVVDPREDIPLSSLELRCVEVKPIRAKPFFVVTWYRPPSDPVDSFDKLEAVFRFLESEGKEIILLGDTNCDVAPAHDASLSSDFPNNTKRILEFYNSFGLKQLISEPTRETTDTSTIIDHIAVSNPSNVVESGVIKCSISDHNLVYMTRKFRGSVKAKHKMIRSRQMKNFDKDLFLQDLASYDWQSIVNNAGSVDDAVNKWSELVSLVIEKHAPIRERRVTERFCPWITPSLKKLFKTRDKLKVKAVKMRSEILMSAYKQVRCKANNLNRKMKREYFSNKLESCEGNIKETWKTVNQLINKRSKTTNILSIKEDEKVISNPQDIAETMNHFFCNVGKDLSDKIPATKNPLLNGDFGDRIVSCSFSFSPLNNAKVLKAFSKVKTSNGFGTDMISSFFLKTGIEILAPSLVQLFNWSLSVGHFPDNWKTARVAPIFKKGSTDDKSNYRPISVLPVVSRLFEKLVFDQLYSYFNNNKLIFSDQSGFRSLHSTLTSLLRCTNDWYLNIDKGLYTAAVYIDLKKAFDTVDHEILLSKLKYYGVEGKEFRWFHSYLANRRQFCRVNGQISSTEPINCGVPQGSCLGPLLFLVYINDLPKCLKHSHVSMYADDTSIYFASNSVSEINEAINADLAALKLWLQGNKLSLNVAKTEGMIIGSRGKLKKLTSSDSVKPQFKIENVDIKMAEDTKYLGVQVDQQLKWSSQLASLTSKISRGIGLLRYSKRYVPASTVKQMYKSLVEPNFRYCCPVWGNVGETSLTKLQTLQNRAARIVTGSRYDQSALPLIRALGWPTVRELLDLETLKMVFKSLNGDAPSYMSDMFTRVSETTSRVLRNSNINLRTPMLRTSAGQGCFSFRGASLWNGLQNELKGAPTIKKFQEGLLKTHKI